VNKHRPQRDGSQEAFITRMHRVNLERDKKLDKKRRSGRGVDTITGQPLFKPVVGRGPNFARNSSAMPIGDFLHASRHEFDDIKSRLKADEERRCKELRQQKFVNGRSEKMLGKMRLREARRIFQTLRATYDASAEEEGGKGGKGKGAARLATHLVDIEAVDVDVLGVVAPLLAALAPDKVSLDVEEFCGMLDEDLLARIDGPQTSKLAIKKATPAADAAALAALEHTTFKPKIDKHSQRLAKEKGRGSVPIHQVHTDAHTVVLSLVSL
jgi:hypothetical protein